MPVGLSGCWGWGRGGVGWEWGQGSGGVRVGKPYISLLVKRTEVDGHSDYSDSAHVHVVKQSESDSHSG